MRMAVNIGRGLLPPLVAVTMASKRTCSRAAATEAISRGTLADGLRRT
jgi:hypothetical protein